jgi:starch synthase
MTPQNLKVLFVCAEAAPYAAIGGLGQVAYFLTKALKKQGIEIALFMPKYGTINEKKWGIKPYIHDLKVPTGESDGTTELTCNIKIKEGAKREPTVYFLENMEYYEKRANVYGYSDDHVRFALLSRAVMAFIKETGMRVNIIHVNDWHTGYLPNYLSTTHKDNSLYKNISTVFTIHNLRSQGMFDFRFASPLDFDDGKSSLGSFYSKSLQKQNALKRGIIFSDLVNTVSETYAREIMTLQYGEGLHDLIKEVRDKMFGVLNGLDYTDFDPATDKVIKKNFSWRSLDNRLANKTDLQKEFDLTVDPEVPIISMIGRLAEQKGIDLLMQVLPPLLSEYKIQFIVLGTGEHKYREFFQNLEHKFPEQVGTHLMSNFTLPRKIFAGTDMLLLPSMFEPGGIVVIEGMRYGAVPIVRATGGLADIVTDFDPQTVVGNGFCFKNYSELSLFGAIVRAVQVYRNKKSWNKLVKRIFTGRLFLGYVCKKIHRSL